MSHEVLPAVCEVTGYTGPREQHPTGLYRADPEASARADVRSGWIAGRSGIRRAEVAG